MRKDQIIKAAKQIIKLHNRLYPYTPAEISKVIEDELEPALMECGDE